MIGVAGGAIGTADGASRSHCKCRGGGVRCRIMPREAADQVASEGLVVQYIAAVSDGVDCDGSNENFFNKTERQDAPRSGHYSGTGSRGNLWGQLVLRMPPASKVASGEPLVN